MAIVKNFGLIPLDNNPDYSEPTDTRTTVNVYEEETLKSRQIGFIWNEPKRIWKPDF